jgi:hypothetical protein
MRGNCLRPTLLLLTALVGCDTNGTLGGIGTTTADVRVLNASTTSIDLLQDQAIGPGNADIGFGASSLCMTVDIISHGLSVRPAGARTAAVQLPSFAANERYLVLVTGTATSLVTSAFRNSFTPAAGKGGVRFINVSGGVDSYDIYVTDPGAALVAPNATAIAPGTASSYFNVPTTAQQVRLITTATGSPAVAFDVGSVTVASGARAAVVLAPPATGGTSARPFVFQIANGGSC